MITVKPMEWEYDEEGWYSVQTVCGPYEARVTDRGAVRIRKPSEAWQAFDGDIDAAFAFLFADYSARIMSAIEPAGVGVETEDVARRIYEDAHKGMSNIWSWNDRGLDDEHPGTRERYLGYARSAIAALKGDEQ